jgi:hypothetical protein
MADEAASESVPLDRLAKVYRKIQAKIQQLTADYDAEFAKLDAQRAAIKTALKDQLLALGIKSVNTEEGTVILSTKTRYSTQDWDAFKQFVIDNDALDLYERRISQTNMATFLRDNPGVVPPGLNSNSEYAISVRKPK